jgi:hypothetical protein
MSAPIASRSPLKFLLAAALALAATLFQIFGMKPSVLMRGDFFEIPSPFTSA